MATNLTNNKIKNAKVEVKHSYIRRSYLHLFLAIFYFIACALPSLSQTTTQSISLYAKSGAGDYFTLFPDGIKKESAYIGGFKSVQLDPLEENIYFFDPVLKVIGKINLQSGKVYKVIGKPKSSTNVDYTSAVSFNDANLNKLTDFTFDKYGNIYILYHNNLSDPNYNQLASDPIILKASFRDNTIKQVLKVEDQFRTDSTLSQYYSFSISGLAYDYDKSIYLYGSHKPGQNPDPNANGPVIIKYDTLSNASEIYGLGNNLAFTGFTPRVTLNPNGQPNFSIKSVAFDKTNNLFICSSLGTNNSANYYVNKVSSTTNSEGFFTQLQFIGDGSGSANDIGDGGEAGSAYALLQGSKCICGDKNGDYVIADTATNRIRRIIKSSGLINTIIGGGGEQLTFGENKSLKSISLQTPTSLLVDKLNNLYVVEPNRILVAKDIVNYVDNPVQYAKIANLAITKVAGKEVTNPSGDINVPDLSLDYSFAGNQTVEVKGTYIPEGTTVKLTTTNSDGTVSPDKPSAMLVAGIASIPVKIDAGASKVIKAETDPFIPSPGVYLAGTEPMIAPGVLPDEPQSVSPKRNDVNLTTKNSSNEITGNLISPSKRFNFVNSGWRKYQDGTVATLNAAADPDENLNDVNLIDFGPNMNLIYLDVPNSTGKVTFSIWIKTADNSDFFLPVGLSQICPDRSATYNFSSPGWETCNMYPVANNSYSSNYKYYSDSFQVNSNWRKITLESNQNLDASGKTIVIGGGAQPTGKKIYIWGARLERNP